MENQSKSSAFLWGSVLVVIALVVFGIYSAVSNTPNTSGPQATNIMETVRADEWIKGNPAAKTTLIEYADFQCPGCAGFYPALRQLENELGPTFKIVFRHFPLPGHANARVAARAAEAAGKQGKFWEMHNMLFENQRSWERSGSADKLFIEYAKSLQLNETQFAADLKSKEIGDKIQASYDQGNDFGVNSTPTFFLDGKKLNFPRTYEELKAQIQAAITANNATSTNATTGTTTSR